MEAEECFPRSDRAQPSAKHDHNSKGGIQQWHFRYAG
jgi:hypothetical protein